MSIIEKMEKLPKHLCFIISIKKEHSSSRFSLFHWIEVSILRNLIIVCEDAEEWKSDAAVNVDDMMLLRVYDHVT